MSKKKKIDLVESKKEILELKLDFDSFLVSIKTEIEKLISEADINIAVPIQSRTKSWDSINEKLERSSMNLNKITDMQDLCGVRIILLFSRDVENVKGIIENNLKIIKSYDTLSRLNNNQFGYSSYHIIASLPEEWLKVPTMKRFKGFKVEIQIRTISQHLWSEASQLLQYKKEQNIPNNILRSVSRVSALLETVDLEFERVLEERDIYRKEIKSNKTIQDEILNVDLLEQILDNYLPPENKGEDEDYAELLNNLLLIKITTKLQLEAFINKNITSALNDEFNKVENLKQETNMGIELYGTSKERIDRGVFYKHSGLLRSMITNEVGKSWHLMI